MDELREVENRLRTMVTAVNATTSENTWLVNENSSLRAQVARLEAMVNASVEPSSGETRVSTARTIQDMNADIPSEETNNNSTLNRRRGETPDDTQGTQACRGGGSSTAQG
eukprot:11718206-Ditylum_brightwellii.AAC.1